MAKPVIERLKAHDERLERAGFMRINCRVHIDVFDLIASEQREGEGVGPTIERLLLGSARQRPSMYPPDYKSRRQRRAERQVAAAERRLGPERVAAIRDRLSKPCPPEDEI